MPHFDLIFTAYFLLLTFNLPATFAIHIQDILNRCEDIRRNRKFKNLVHRITKVAHGVGY